MRSWIAAHYELGDRAALVRIDRELLFDLYRMSPNLGDTVAPEPGAVADFVERLVAICRPDLAGGWAVAVSFSASDYCWEVVYCHGSLGRAARFERLPRLDISVSRDQAAQFFRESAILPDVVAAGDQP